MSTRNLSDLSGTEIPSAENFSFGILVSKWNPEITGSLYKASISFLKEKGVKEENILVREVPGSFELTVGANMLLVAHPHLNAVICLGCVIQGETRHFDYICSAVANGVTQVSIARNTPVIFGVLTTDDLQQAVDRSGGKHGNKGTEAAATAIQMAALQLSLT